MPSVLKSLAPFGIRHEIAKRYPPLDWLRSKRVSKQIDGASADILIAELLRNDKPGLVGRIGGTEARFIGAYSKIVRNSKFGIPRETGLRISRLWKKRNSEVFTNAGFYHDSIEEVEEFCNLYRGALVETDIQGVWGVAFTWVESLYFDSHRTKAIPVGSTAPWVEPYFRDNKPWSLELEGKRVLVISGFSDSITKQHHRIKHVFPDVDYPTFSLETIKAPLVAGQRSEDGRNWHELLQDMKDQMTKIDFDVALISAGAFSYPLAHFAKDLGKIGIHCGGGLQLFFGVMGNRWNNSPEVLKFVNDAWVRPSAEERPRSADAIENACYW
jgi:hypothetical protein